MSPRCGRDFEARRSLGDQVGGVIDLLAWDAVASDAVAALRRVASENLDLLTRRLLDPDEDFAVRRRLVAVLADCFTDQSFEALLGALGDRRFEVRYRAGGALARMMERMPGVRVKEDQVMNAIHRELTVERGSGKAAACSMPTTSCGRPRRPTSSGIAPTEASSMSSPCSPS